MKQRLLANRHWALGVLLSAAGVLTARLTGDHPVEWLAVVAHVAGLLIAGSGLFVIAVGVRRAAAACADDKPGAKLRTTGDVPVRPRRPLVFLARDAAPPYS